MADFKQIIAKVKDLAQQHPDQTREALDRAEQEVDSRTGGKYTEQVKQGKSMTEQQLGVPTEETTPPAQPTEPSQPGQ